MMTRTRTPHHPESGGLTILMALVMLVVVTVAAFGLSRSSLREVLITGNESTGRKAFEMADSGLDYVISWGSPYATTAATPTAAALQTKMGSLLDAIDLPGVAQTGFIDSSGTLRYKMLASTVGGDMTPSPSAYLQKSAVTPAFDLEVRYLGQVPLQNTGSGGFIKSNRSFWLVHSTGRANIGTTGQSFISQREALVQYIN